MDDLSRALGADGGGWKVPFDGQVLTLSTVTQALKSEWTSWRRMVIRQAAADSKGLTAGQAREQWQAINAAVADGTYDWGSEDWLQTIRKPKGFRRLVYLMLRERQPGVTEQQAQELIDANQELVVAAVNEALNLPKATTPLEEGE